MTKRRALSRRGIAVLSGIAAIAVGFWADAAVQHWVSAHQTAALRSWMLGVSKFGDWPAHVVLGLALLGLAWWRRDRKWMRVFAAMLLACAIAGAAARVIKVAVGRPRPSVKVSETWNGPRLAEKYHAFPSGHTASSVAFFAVLFFVRWRIAICCLPIPLLIAFSRMYVGAHYLSDVLFAMMLGLVSAYFAARVIGVLPRAGGSTAAA